MGIHFAIIGAVGKENETHKGVRAIMAHKIIVDKVLEAQKQKLANGTIEFADKYPGDVFLKDFSDTPCQVGIHPANLDSPTTTGAKQMQANTAKELFVSAAQDERILGIIEDLLMNEKHDVSLTEYLAYAVQEYIALPGKETKAALASLAKDAQLGQPYVFAKKVETSPAFESLLKEYLEKQPAKQTIVATNTTATAIAQQSQAKASNSKPESVTSEQLAVTNKKGSKSPKTPKSKSVRPMPTIVSLEALEAMDRKALMSAMGALNDNHVTGVRANGNNLDIKVALAKHILGVTYVAPAKAAKAPKASSKKTKVEAILELPEGLSWDEVKNMKYRQLQQLGKIFRSQGHEIPRLNSKGDDIRKAIANAMRSQGHDITEVAITSQGPAKDLHLPNWGAVKEQKRLERVATEALRMDATDAKVHMELAVAA